MHNYLSFELSEWSHKGKHIGLDSYGHGLYCLHCPASSISSGGNRILPVEGKCTHSFTRALLASALLWFVLRALQELYALYQPPLSQLSFSFPSLTASIPDTGLSSLRWMPNSAGLCPLFRTLSVFGDRHLVHEAFCSCNFYHFLWYQLYSFSFLSLS